MYLLVKLILAHLLGDFVFQPGTWAKDKQEKKLRSAKFYFHIAIHLVLVFLLVWDITLWKELLIYISIHFVLDAAKIVLQKESNQRRWFFWDQLFHFAIIIAFWVIVIKPELNIEFFNSKRNLWIVTLGVFLTNPSAIIIRELISKWTNALNDKESDSLKNAGKYIGILERLFVFAFILFNQWSAIGFLIAAKSVFRFGDLKESKDRKLTEYILIGTLISFGFAIIAGILILELIQNAII